MQILPRPGVRAVHAEGVRTSECRQPVWGQLWLLGDREVTFGFCLPITLCFSDHGIEDILFLLLKKNTSVLFHFEKVKGDVATPDNRIGDEEECDYSPSFISAQLLSSA